MLDILATGSPEAIGALVAGACTAVAGAACAIIKAINDGRRRKGIDTCCVTGRKLKPKKAKIKVKVKKL